MVKGYLYSGDASATVYSVVPGEVWNLLYTDASKGTWTSGYTWHPQGLLHGVARQSANRIEVTNVFYNAGKRAMHLKIMSFFFAMTASISMRNRETCSVIFSSSQCPFPLLLLSGVSSPGAAMPISGHTLSISSRQLAHQWLHSRRIKASHEVAFEYRALWIQAASAS